MAKKQVFVGPKSYKQRVFMTDNTTDILLYGGGAGAGKALEHGEKVLTTEGWKNIEDISVGDKVVTPSGKEETVKDVWPQGIVKIYKVKFQDGRESFTCGEHLWEFHRAGKGKVASKVGTTLEMKKYVDKSKGKPHGNPIIPLCSPIEFSEATLPVDPYVLGVILGDGNVTTYSTSITSADPFIYNEIEKAGYTLGKERLIEGNQAMSRNITGFGKLIGASGIRYTNSKTKFIPEEYKTGSIEQRFSVLQGLFDTDGYVDDIGRVEFYTISKQMAQDVKDILFSLGFSVTTNIKKSHYKKDGVKVLCSDCYRLYVRGKDQSSLFRLPRKKERTKVKEVGLKVVGVEYVRENYATCIAITGEEKLFLTNNFVVTHNSHCAMLKQLELISDEDARIVFIRNTRPQLIAPGALVDESKSIYMPYKPRFRSDILEYTFQSGCKISFKTINSSADLSGYDGTQFTRIIFDEVQNQYGEEAVVYLMSRLRSKSKAHHQMIFTANPRDCWLKSWVEYCLDDDGVPKPGTENIVRWFVRINNKMHWADSKKALLKKFPDSMPISFRFIPATCEDNPVLLENNPGYIANLKSLKKSDQLRLWKGSWSVTEDSQGYFKREWVSLVDQIPPGLQLVRAWDLASSPEPSEGTPGDPDYSAGVLMGRSKAGHYYVLDVNRFRKRTNEVIEEIIRTAKSDGVDDCQVVLTKDPGAAGAYLASFLSRTLTEHGIIPKILTMSGHKNKLQRFLPFAALAESGNVFVLKAAWNKDFFEELERFTGGTRGQHDDMVDGVSDGTCVLARQNTLPVFDLPSMTKSSILS